MIDMCPTTTEQAATELVAPRPRSDCVRFGWVNRTFRCKERTPEYQDDGSIVTVIVAKALNAAVHTDLLTADYTTGTSVTTAVQDEPPETPLSLTVTSAPLAIDFAWTLGTFWQLHGIVELWEHTANTPFSSATKIWEVRGSRVRIRKTDLTGRFYWIRVRTIGGQVSGEFPNGNGTAGVALFVDSPNIAPNAATDIATFSLAGPSTATASSSESTKQNLSVNFTPAVNCDVIVRATCMASHDGAAGTALLTAFIALQDTTGLQEGPQKEVLNTAPAQTYAVEGRFSVTGGTTYKGGLRKNATSSRQVNCIETSVTVEIIKR